MPELAEDEFSNLFVLMPGAGKAQLVRGYYGKADLKSRTGNCPTCKWRLTDQLPSGKKGSAEAKPVKPPAL